MHSSIKRFISKCHTPQEFIIIQAALVITVKQLGRPRDKQQNRQNIDTSTLISFLVNQMFAYYLRGGISSLGEQSRLTAHTHTCTPVGGFVPNRGSSPHNNLQLHRHIHELQQLIVEEDIYGLPGVAFCQEKPYAARLHANQLVRS